jgi:hypothetical protein
MTGAAVAQYETHRTCCPVEIGRTPLVTTPCLSLPPSSGPPIRPQRVERDLIRTRTAEGRSRAKAQGKHMGQPLPSPGTEERGSQAALPGRDVAGIGAQLQRQPRHHFTIGAMT